MVCPQQNSVTHTKLLYDYSNGGVLFLIRRYFVFSVLLQRFACHGQHTYLFTSALLHSATRLPRGGYKLRRVTQDLQKCALAGWVTSVKIAIDSGSGLSQGSVKMLAGPTALTVTRRWRCHLSQWKKRRGFIKDLFFLLRQKKNVPCEMQVSRMSCTSMWTFDMSNVTAFWSQYM